LAQYRVPMQRLYAMSLSPSGLCTVAFTGHTFSQGASSQCTHASGWKATAGSLVASASRRCRASGLTK
jgi:hypothetical protein